MKHLSHSPPIFFHLKLVAKVSLAVGALAALVLLAVLTLITGATGETYGDIIRLHSLTRQQLGPAMLVAGLLLVAVTGAVTCLIVYYTSFRVAGPLYRFSQNLKLARTDGQAVPLALRRGDALGQQALAIEQALGAVRAHGAALALAGAAAAAALAADDAPAYAAALARLKGLGEEVRL